MRCDIVFNTFLKGYHHFLATYALTTIDVMCESNMKRAYLYYPIHVCMYI